MSERFAALANKAATLAGNYVTFLLALGIVLLWAIAGPLFGFSETWQLVINTGTTIITFLMVFLIQSTQNRDSKTINIKLDELLRAVHGARTGLVNLAELSDEDLLQLEQEIRRLGEREGIRRLRDEKR
jgi:low affinity Fe/Cu permease